MSQSNTISLVKELNEIGIALSAERDSVRLMDLIVQKSMDLTDADAGTLYTVEPGQELNFRILKNRSLGIHQGGISGRGVDAPPIRLNDEDGRPNRRLVVACCVVDEEPIRVADVENSEHYDFSGTRDFDRRFGYRSQSFIAVPMKNHENEIIGVLQLINKLDRDSGEITAFSELDQEILQSLASQAAVTMTKQALIDEQRGLFDGFIQLLATAIDQKSPYTGSHCRRVPVLTTMLAHAVCRVDRGPLKHFSMNDTEMYELEVAGWLHDCGKITIPDYVIDKSTKLETMYDRIHAVNTRLEVLRRDAIIGALRERLEAQGVAADPAALAAHSPALADRLGRLEEYRHFLGQCNIGGESMDEAAQARVDEIAAETWESADGLVRPLLNEDERRNLQIARGTLNADEREVVNGHMQATIDMLESLPYPRHLRRVPEYAGGHHERMDGSGFPRGLRREEMSLPARMMAIADVFEALTACDRPYKKAMSLSQALTILGNMKLNNHIDPDLFDVFVHEKVYLDYAREYLSEEQQDEVDPTRIPGYRPLTEKDSAGA